MLARVRHLLPRLNYWLAQKQRDDITLHPDMSRLFPVYKGFR
jgi:hypothetical protein